MLCIWFSGFELCSLFFCEADLKCKSTFANLLTFVIAIRQSRLLHMYWVPGSMVRNLYIWCYYIDANISGIMLSNCQWKFSVRFASWRRVNDNKSIDWRKKCQRDVKRMRTNQ